MASRNLLSLGLGLLLVSCSAGRTSFAGKDDQVDDGLTAGDSGAGNAETHADVQSSDNGVSSDASESPLPDSDLDSSQSDGETETEDLQGDCPTGCFIAGTCYSEGEVSAANGCQACDPVASRTTWSNDEGRSCDDALYCTVEDHCSAGQCVGDERLCDDGVACNGAETCDEVSAKCAGAESTCVEGELCNVQDDACGSTCAGCVIDGSCYADGESSPTNPCLICEPATTAEDWTIDAGAVCDDDDLCTEQDACSAQGQCSGDAVTCQDDAGDCGATRSCDPGTGECAPQFPGNSVTCNDSDACTANDRCDGAGECAGTPSVDPGAGCTCIDDSDCNDNLACTEDTCSASICSNTVNSGSCLIGGACVADDSPDPSNPCRACDAAANNTGWTNAGAGTSCDDGAWCTGADTCSSGTCQHEFSGNARCTASGPCALTTCDEHRDSCYEPAGTVCANIMTVNRCANDECGGSSQAVELRRSCTGSSAECPATATEEVVSTTDCAADQACSDSDGQCGAALGCGNTYCDGALCWMTLDTPFAYSQANAASYCSVLVLAGNTDWRLPTVDEARSIFRDCDGRTETCDIGDGPGVGGCYWPTEMGACAESYWSSELSLVWLPDRSLVTIYSAEENFPVRCVTDKTD